MWSRHDSIDEKIADVTDPVCGHDNLPAVTGIDPLHCDISKQRWLAALVRTSGDWSTDRRRPNVFCCEL